MDFSNAITAGYNIGKDLGYHVSGQAAEDIRLNREAKRAEIDFNNQRMQVLQAQEAREQDKYNKEVMYQKATGVKDLSKQAILAPELFLQDFIDGANSFNDEYQHFPGIRLMPFDQQLAEQQFLDFYIPAANSIYGSVKDPNDPGYQKSLAQIKSGLVMQVDENTGKITPVYVGEYLTTLGGNAGLQYIYQKIAADEAAAALKARDTQSQIERRDIQNATDIANAQTKADELNFKKGQDARTQDNIAQVINSQGGLSNVKRMDKDSVTMHSPGASKGADESTINTPDDAAQYKMRVDNYFKDFLDLYKNGRGELDLAKSDIAAFKFEAGKNNALKDSITESMVNFSRQMRFEALQNPELSPAIRTKMLKDAEEFDRTMYDEDKTYKATNEKEVTYNMAISSNILEAIAKGDTQGIFDNIFGIMNTLKREVEDWTNMETADFEKQIGLANLMQSVQPQLLAAIFQGRMTNKIYSQLATSSLWRSKATNLSTLRNNLATIKDQIALAKVRPGLEAKRDAQVLALDNAIYNLDKLTTGQAQIKDGSAYIAKSKEDAIANSRDRTAIYFNSVSKTADIYYPDQNRTEENPNVIKIPGKEFDKEYGVSWNFLGFRNDPYGSKLREIGIRK